METDQPYVHDATGVLYYAQPRGAVGRIFFGRVRGRESWYSAHDHCIYTKPGGNKILGMEAVTSENTLLLPYFNHMKLETIEGRNKAYAILDDIYDIISDSHHRRETSRPEVPNPGSTINTCKQEDDKPPAIRDLQARVKMLADTLEPVCRWIFRFLLSQNDPIFAVIFDGSPVPAAQDLEPFDLDRNGILELALGSFSKADFNPVAKMIRYSSCRPVLKRLIPAVTSLLLRSLYQMDLTIWQTLSTRDPKRIETMIQTCLAKLKELDDRILAAQTDLIAPVFAHYRAYYFKKEEELWWKSSREEDKQEKLGELWQSVKHDRKYRTLDETAILERLADIRQYLVLDSMMRFAAKEESLVTYREQLSILMKDMESMSSTRIKVESET